MDPLGYGRGGGVTVWAVHTLTVLPELLASCRGVLLNTI